MSTEELLTVAVRASIRAGKAILEVYNSDFAVEHKEDKSPLTQADKSGHEEIMKFLIQTGLPVLSEEGKNIDYDERSEWKSYWCVDPLDGTKEFIKRNGEFTVNIALVENGNPIAGVIYVPVTGVLYFSSLDKGAYKTTLEGEEWIDLDQLRSYASKLPVVSTNRAFTVVASRSHMTPETETFINELKSRHGEIAMTSMGSSLKLCLVAEGIADVYPRFAPTMEWDTAAGQAIVQGSGRNVISHQTGVSMRYNKENLLNDWFIVQ